jgi:hypothetical protein
MAAVGHALVRLEHSAVGGARGLWKAIARLAENLSDAGHGPNEPREEAGPDNPYAGHGPVRPVRNDEDRPSE